LLDEEARHLGWPALHARLAHIDPATAARLPPTDSQRIQRALEVFMLAGRPMSTLLGNQACAPARIACVALEPSVRAELHARIAQRFDRMLARGLCEELAGLRKQHVLHEGLPSMRCVGYRQAWDHLEGRIDAGALREQGIAATRQLAKRQLTWLRSMPDRVVVDCLAGDAEEKVCAAVAQVIRAAQSSGKRST
jgi:tRNA dimethylallyltransferase